MNPCRHESLHAAEERSEPALHQRLINARRSVRKSLNSPSIHNRRIRNPNHVEHEPSLPLPPPSPHPPPPPPIPPASTRLIRNPSPPRLLTPRHLLRSQTAHGARRSAHTSAMRVAVARMWGSLRPHRIIDDGARRPFGSGCEGGGLALLGRWGLEDGAWKMGGKLQIHTPKP